MQMGEMMGFRGRDMSGENFGVVKNDTVDRSMQMVVRGDVQ
jgi:hypothetical protein